MLPSSSWYGFGAKLASRQSISLPLKKAISEKLRVVMEDDEREEIRRQ